jgi:tetratricopeptide (TPR) repeat protein
MLSWFAVSVLSAGPLAHAAEDVAEPPEAPEAADAPAPAAAAGPPAPIESALEIPKKGKWDPKGKAIDPFGRGDAKRKQLAWEEAIPLLVTSLEKQPGCGKCLVSLAIALTEGQRYEDAVRVGQVLNTVYPERKEGWQRISETWTKAQHEEEAIEATSKYLEIEKDDSNMWWRRNQFLLQLGQYDEAAKWFDGAAAAGLPDQDLACLKIQLMAAQSDPVGARDLWSTCDGGENVDLRRYTEGWLAVAEGDPELAAKRLAMSTNDDFARLMIAFIRLDQEKYEVANNLVTRLFPKKDWALDAHLAHAEALHGLGKDDEALAVLTKTLMGEGWQERHKSLSAEQMLLKTRGPEWPKDVGRRAVTVNLEILKAKGDMEGAHALYLQAAEIYGPADALKRAAGEPPTFTSAGGQPVDAAYQASIEGVITKAMPKLQGCIDTERKKAPTLAGRVVAKMTVGANGSVTEPSLVSTTLGNPAAEACLVKQLTALKFPAPPAGAVAVAYPFEFAPPASATAGAQPKKP